MFPLSLEQTIKTLNLSKNYRYVLFQDEVGRNILLLGEFHVKNKAAQEETTRLAALFNHIAVEGTFCKKFAKWTKYPFTFYDKFINYIQRNSSIDGVLSRATTEKTGIHLTLLEKSDCKEASFSENFAAWLTNGGLLLFTPISFCLQPLVAWTLLILIFVFLYYQLVWKRDNLMTANLITSNIQHYQTLAIVGRGHLRGMTKLLKKAGYKIMRKNS